MRCIIVAVVVYIFRIFNQYIFTKFKDKNNEEERRSGATGTGVSQKDLQLGNTNFGKKALKKFAEKGSAHRKLELETLRL